ncbi:LysR family transcriptional regulator [Paenibacillus sp. CN-4]|uniref:LysR family transcriptional regulator n=1 Tax=Paenibacillus nanchangensis TaxID=3348343 RepID=UPI00397AF55B
MDLTYFHTFREVAYHRSFTKAAAELGYAQSSVTTQVQKLEQDYGVKLFERHGKGLRLTSAGEELQKVAAQMLDLYQQSKEMLHRQGGGTLTIGTIDSLASYYLPQLIQPISRKYPSLRIRLQPERESDIIEQVKEGALDIGLMLESKPSDPALNWIEIREEPLVLISSPRHPLAGTDRITLEQLHGEEWIMTEDSCNYRIMLETVLKGQAVPYRIALELGNPEAIKRCVMGGFGIALLPQMAVEEEIRRGELAALPFSHPDIRLALHMLVHPKKWISQSLRDFMEALR